MGVIEIVVNDICLDFGILYHLISLNNHLEKSLNRGFRLIHLLAASEQLDCVFWVDDDALVAGIEVESRENALILLLDGEFPFFLKS